MGRWIVVPLLICLAWPSGARELNRQSYLLGERAAGMGGAFVALAGDPASTFYNPAGLAGLSKQGLSLSASVYRAYWEHYERLLDVDEDLQADMDSESFSTFPSSVIYTLPLTSPADPDALHHVLALSLLVPDFDRFEGGLNQPSGYYLFEMKGSYKIEELTYWAGPTYGLAIGPNLRLGISFFGLCHLSDTRSNLAIKGQGEQNGAEVNWYEFSNMERSGWGLTMLIQAGMQIDLGDHLSLGLTVRSPTFGNIYSRVHQLEFNSSHAEDLVGNPILLDGFPSFADRVETSQVEMDYRLPLMFALGIAYQVPGSWTLAVDLSVHLPLARHSRFSGPLVFPRDPAGDLIADPMRALDPQHDLQNSWVINANLGAELFVSSNWMIRCGLFSDMAAVDRDFHDTDEFTRAEALILPAMHRIGMALGGGRIGEWNTSSVSMVYVYGFGRTAGLNDMFAMPSNRSQVTSHSLTLVLAGSADL